MVSVTAVGVVLITVNGWCELSFLARSNIPAHTTRNYVGNFGNICKCDSLRQLQILDTLGVKIFMRLQGFLKIAFIAVCKVIGPEKLLQTSSETLFISPQAYPLKVLVLSFNSLPLNIGIRVCVSLISCPARMLLEGGGGLRADSTKPQHSHS